MWRASLKWWVVAIAVWMVAVNTLPTRAATMGAVVGTDSVNLRSCPSLSCDVIDVAPLGESLEVTGDAVDGFVPVRYWDETGYVYQLYLSTGSAPTLIEGTAGCNRVALIFNVGIGDKPVLGILDSLQRASVPATVFPMGWWAREHPDLLQQIANAGFAIGSHGDQPMELTGLADRDVVDDIQSAADAIAEAIGQAPGPWFTPYAAAIDDRVRTLVARAGYLPVGWTVPADDYGPDATADGVYARVMDNIYDGAIVELHLDGPASATATAYALPWIVHDLRARGFHFVTIPQMADPCS